MKITVTVTDDDIDRGERRQACRCPVARAISRTLRLRLNMIGVAPNLDKLGWHVSLYGHSPVPLPREAADRVNTYDQTGIMEPFSFELETPFWGDLKCESPSPSQATTSTAAFAEPTVRVPSPSPCHAPSGE